MNMYESISNYFTGNTKAFHYSKVDCIDMTTPDSKPKPKPKPRPTPTPTPTPKP